MQADIEEKSSDKSGIMTEKTSIDEQVAKLEQARNEARERLEEVQSQMEQFADIFENMDMYRDMFEGFSSAFTAGQKEDST